MLLMVPALFGVSVSQINLLLDTVLASFLQTGSVSWLYYADRLSELPLGAFGIAIGTVILPSLSRQHAGEDPKAFSATLDWALRMVLLVGVPAALALGILSEPMIASLFYYGAMSEEAVVQSARALQAYSLGVLAFMLIKVLAPGFFARQDLKTPVRVAVICMVANMVMNLILIWPLQHVGWRWRLRCHPCSMPCCFSGAVQDRRLSAGTRLVAVRPGRGGGLCGDGGGGLVAERAGPGLVPVGLAAARAATGLAGLCRPLPAGSC